MPPEQARLGDPEPAAQGHRTTPRGGFPSRFEPCDWIDLSSQSTNGPTGKATAWTTPFLSSGGGFVSSFVVEQSCTCDAAWFRHYVPLSESGKVKLRVFVCWYW